MFDLISAFNSSGSLFSTSAARQRRSVSPHSLPKAMESAMPLLESSVTRPRANASGAGKGKWRGQRYDHVRAVLKGPPGPKPLFEHGGLAPLHEVPTHYGNGKIGTGRLFGFLQLIGVAVVKGVVFGYYSH